MFRFFYILSVVLLVKYISAKSCKCKCNQECVKSDPPLKLIYQITPFYKEVQACDRVCKTKSSVSKDGARRISHRFEINAQETGSDVCGCVLAEISQKDWLSGSESICCVKNNFATLTLEGKPDPTFNQQDEDSSFDRLELSQAMFLQFPEAKLENHYCRLSTNTDKSDCIHFKVICELRPDSPCKEEICDGLLHYLNQDYWLGKLTSECRSDGELLDLEFFGDSPKHHCSKNVI